MCGIAGWIAASARAPAPDVTTAMLGVMAHRGPDGEGMHHASTGREEYRVALGHRRLAIIDVEGGQQPMHDEAVGLSVVFNGEIYNFRELREKLESYGYRFERDSDTEVLLRGYRHWSTRVVEHLRGMFAFAIWDARRERLMLARDRFGEKPLYLHQRDDGSVFFASEIKALLEVPGIEAEVDHEAVFDYLAYRYVPGPKSMFKGISKLMPGSFAVWKRGQLGETRYWESPDGRELSPARPSGDRLSDFIDYLDEAVHMQMVSDVPFGAFLSGGLDSSTIVALMRRHNDEVKTFSVGFGDPGYSELAYAREVARHLDTSHHEIVVSERDLIDKLPDLVRYRDAPVAEPSDIPIYMLAREAARSVKMVLTGEGSDELFGGYPKHVAERCVGAWQALPRLLRSGLIAPFVRSLPYGQHRLKTALANLEIEDRRERYVRWFGALSAAERRRLIGRHCQDGQDGGCFDGIQFDTEDGTTALRRILYFDQMSWLPDNLLERTDRMTMAASIEARVPFLDHRLAEFTSTLPDNFRVRGRCGKWILRQAARTLLPRSILERPKVGFRVPVNEWFRGPMRDFLLDHLRSGSSITRNYYDTRELDRLLDEHVTGRHNHEKLLWALLNLEIWHRTYV